MICITSSSLNATRRYQKLKIVAQRAGLVKIEIQSEKEIVQVKACVGLGFTS
jgi:hypothetical protein